MIVIFVFQRKAAFQERQLPFTKQYANRMQNVCKLQICIHFAYDLHIVLAICLYIGGACTVCGRAKHSLSSHGTVLYGDSTVVLYSCNPMGTGAHSCAVWQELLSSHDMVSLYSDGALFLYSK